MNSFDEILSKMPRILVRERDQSIQNSRIAADIILDRLPSIFMDSKARSLLIEKSFDNSFALSDEDEGNDRKRKTSKIIGKIEFKMFWSSKPQDTSSQFPTDNERTVMNRSSIIEDPFWIFDPIKRLVRSFDDLDVIEQWFFDTRFQMDELSLQTIDEIEGHHKRMELIRLLLAQKYHLEFNQLQHERKGKLGKIESDRISPSNSSSKSSLKVKINKKIVQHDDLGIFCDDEEIESNKRYQLMIARANRIRNNLTMFEENLRFIPLNDLDLTFWNTNRIETKEQSQTKLLQDFIRASCERQLKRLDENDGFGNETEWKDISIKVKNLHRLARQLVQQICSRSSSSSSSLNVATENDVSGGVGAIRKSSLIETNRNDDREVCSTSISSLNEIIKEPTIETITLNLAFANLFQTQPTNRKLNPSRKNRKKISNNFLDAIDHEFEIHLSIQRASNVSIRSFDGRENFQSKFLLDFRFLLFFFF